MKKRHYITAIVLLIVIVLLSASACSSKPLNDEAVLKNMQKALEARWKQANNSPSSYNSYSEQKEHYTKLVNLELDAIGDVSAYTFEDPALKELAEGYYQALQNQIEGAKYIGADDSKYNELYLKHGYNDRTRIICRLADEYGLTVSSTYAGTFDEVVSEGRVYLELDEEVLAMEGLINADVVLEAKGGSYYDFVIKNTTQYDLSGATIEFNFYDDNNILVDSASEYMDSWKAGSTNQGTAYSNASFSKAEARVVLYSSSLGDNLVTDYHPVNYVNNMKIEVVLKTTLPVEISYSGSRSVYTKCEVTDFGYEEGRWSNGKASVILKVSERRHMMTRATLIPGTLRSDGSFTAKTEAWLIPALSIPATSA